MFTCGVRTSVRSSDGAADGSEESESLKERRMLGGGLAADASFHM